MRLFDDYIQRMFHPPNRSKVEHLYSEEQTKHWLNWLAHRMIQESQSICLIERMQPILLEDKRLQRIYRLIYGLIVGLIVGLINGGVACIQHFSLRLILYRNGHIPWNYTRFLDYATDRLFLQRVGGGYRFMHRLLQEHFATHYR